jgi:hypothetical protein
VAFPILPGLRMFGFVSGGRLSRRRRVFIASGDHSHGHDDSFGEVEDGPLASFGETPAGLAGWPGGEGCQPTYQGARARPVGPPDTSSREGRPGVRAKVRVAGNRDDASLQNPFSLDGCCPGNVARRRRITGCREVSKLLPSPRDRGEKG